MWLSNHISVAAWRLHVCASSCVFASPGVAVPNVEVSWDSGDSPQQPQRDGDPADVPWTDQFADVWGASWRRLDVFLWDGRLTKPVFICESFIYGAACQDAETCWGKTKGWFTERQGSVECWKQASVWETDLHYRALSNVHCFKNCLKRSVLRWVRGGEKSWCNEFWRRFWPVKV